MSEPASVVDELAGERARRVRTAPWWMIAVAGVATQFLLMLNGVFAARMLGVQGRGQVVLVVILATAASQLTLGGSLPNVVSRQLAEHGVTARDGLRGMFWRWLMWGMLAGAAAGSYLLLLNRHHIDQDIWLLAGAVMVSAVQAMSSQVLIGAMMGEGTTPARVAMTGLLPQVVVVAVVGTALALGAHWNAVELLGVVMLCTGLVLAGRFRVLRTATGRPEDRLDRRDLAREARRTHIGSVGPIDGLGVDRLLVGSLLGNFALGLYSAAFALGGLTNIFGLCLAMVALPRIAQVQDDPAGESRFVRSWLLLSMGLLSVVVIGLEVIVHPLIHYTFGADFLPAVPTARWLVVGSGLLGYRRVLIAVLQGRHRGGIASVVELALTPVMAIGIVACAAVDSLVGVGITMTVVGAASCVALGIAVVRSGPGRVGEDAPKADVLG